MTNSASILIISLLSICGSLIVRAQLAPTESPQSFVASLTSFWPAAPAPKSFTFELPAHDRVQSTTDFKTWHDRPEIAVTNRFTVTNGMPYEFFRTMPAIVLPMYEASGNYQHVQQPKEWHGWLTNYNRCVGYWVCILRAPATYRLFTNSPAAITLMPDEYQAEITWGWRWQDNNGNEI